MEGDKSASDYIKTAINIYINRVNVIYNYRTAEQGIEMENRLKIQPFIVEHLLGKDVIVYCGGIYTFRGNVKACSDGVLTLEITENRYSHISVDSIITIKYDEES
ncbi:MM0924 family protein [Methanolobus sediminis]|uniref:MM0924 family protein n=1 Tax=Methanolobus sediminis TaxID=3072978 RepID=UPI003F68D7DF